MTRSNTAALLFVLNILPLLAFHPLSHKSAALPFFVPGRSTKNPHLLGAKSDDVIIAKQRVIVGDEIGRGSYGTVHLLTLQEREEEETTTLYIGKRPWRQDEVSDDEDPKERASRCLYYWEVEEHVFSKLPSHPQLPPYFGKNKDNWMIFGLVGKENKPAPCLGDLMKLDVDHPQDLKHIGEALGCSSYAETLDKTLESILTVLDHVHDHKIVHRDIKPNNLLVHDGKLVLIDFGSACDLEPLQGSLIPKRRGLENGSRVAVSPIYCAPEVFIDVNDSPVAFDIFSLGLLFCQLLFSYLDERVDAGFHQQLKETDWDLNLWLSNELGGKLRPGGLDHSLEYLSERPGLWTLLEAMLSVESSKRPTTKQALKRLRRILDQDDGLEDGPFFSMVIESMETCEIPTISRPLHFVATFSRKESLGLILSELDDEEENPLWREATKDAVDGEVFVKEVVPGGQADELGIFQVGDRLHGIGELTFTGGGFEKAVEMLQDQPKRAQNVKLHFDRLRIRENKAIPMIPSNEVEIHIADLGAWQVTGKRKAQEDTFILHEIHDAKDRSVLISGVMDGHGGTAASTMVMEKLPTLLSNQLLVNRLAIPDALSFSWETICDAYRSECMNGEECIAAYDPKEGILSANTGSEDLIAGTTATIMALDEKTGKLTMLNCGDSRSLVVTPQGKVKFATEDHTPQTEIQRIQEGIEAGLDYSLPKCSISKSWIDVGKYQYAVGRSLEGPFATSKGVVSNPDVTTTQAQPGEILVSACDGMWEVMDSSEVAIDLYKMREKGMPARDAARALCSLALKKGTWDNVSATVVYL